jgi:hypothetical protein
MKDLSEFLMVLHIIGLTFAAGAAFIKTILLVRCKKDYRFLTTYFQTDKLLTMIIITGMIILTLTGIIWLLIGYSFEPLLITKIVLVGFIWILGPIIDNKATPKLRKMAPVNEEKPSPEFLKVQKKHFYLEITATIIMYSITIIGVLL